VCGRTSRLSTTTTTITHTSFSYTAQTMIPPNSNPLTYPTPTQVASSSTTPPLLLAQANICIKTNRTFRERRDEVEQLQKRCTAASLEKGVVDGWSDEVKRGVSGWVDDIEVSWRCLRVSFSPGYVLDLWGIDRELITNAYLWGIDVSEPYGTKKRRSRWSWIP
jgi:hypothetical protein